MPIISLIVLITPALIIINGMETITLDEAFGKENPNLSIYGVTFFTEDMINRMSIPWHEGFVLYIEKDGVVIKLEGLEVLEVVKALPRTWSGRYI